MVLHQRLLILALLLVHQTDIVVACCHIQRVLAKHPDLDLEAFLSDWKLAAELVRVRPILLVPTSWWSQDTQSMVPEFESAGWWQKLAAEMQCVEYVKCGETKELPKFDVGQKGIGGWCTFCQRKKTEKRAQLD